MARTERHLHRRLATLAVAVIAWLAVTGLALNHAADLRLHERPLPDALANLLYAPALPDPLDGYRLDGHAYAAALGVLYRDDTALAPCTALRGAQSLAGLLALACPDAVHLLAADGMPVDRVDAAWGLDGDIRAVTVAPVAGAPALAIVTTAGTWCLDANATALAPCDVVVTATAPEALPADARDRLAAALATEAVDLERFLHDLHTGRLFGAQARWAWDLFGLALLALAGSGLVMLRRRER